ncbi:MAG: hypothetical protein A2Y10_00785 [Planctomycetes bacterium GWF2_41_51]|nr:MAG: hypothetical protein A2Y10_00785 [Planctomycetes bacterium GWF2_41_51]HBG26747.1 hypothetical protein [Phycisphaerales bacterium]
MNGILLQSLDFIRQDGKPIEGLTPVPKNDDVPSLNLSIDEQSVLFEAKLFKHIDFVFFRRFSNKRSSQVAAYVVDNSDNRLNEDALSELHHQVWLQGRTPLLYIAWPSHIDILACARGPDFWNKDKQRSKYKPACKFESDLLTVGEISDELKQFSAYRLADGTFWDDPRNNKLANYDKAAHKSLIQAVVDADKDLDGKNNPLSRRLLLLMVLIKYLEDRKVFPNDGWFGRYHKGAKNFFEVLKGGEPNEVQLLLDFLASKFNGDIFDIAHLSKQLTKKTLNAFSVLIEAKTINRQLYLWNQYSFEHLPVEIISHLYQRFVQDGHGAVYTPPFLAALLLDHVMPYRKITGKERILDPACGSGVFLVGAFRRLINFYKSKNDWGNLEVEQLKSILRQSIYGVDLDTSAIDLTAFSLSLAICDGLKPEVIWNKLKFDRLRDSNLFESDFFELLLNSQNGSSNILRDKFDIIIGNPPFESKLTDAAKQIDIIAQQDNLNRGKCPDNQIAYLFLEQALSVLKPKSGCICIIQPSGLFYNKNTYSFRTNIFQKYSIKTILDFTSIRNLYEADPKTVAMLANAQKPRIGNSIEHWTFRRTISVKEKICFELDHYDYHHIVQEKAENNPYIWRANLMGGGRLVDISQRLGKIRTLAQYIQQQKWDCGEGYIVGKKGKQPAPFLTGKPFLPTRAFTLEGIDETKISVVTEKKFCNPKTESLFSSPLILIKENESLPIAFWSKGCLAYKDKIIGIHAPNITREIEKLKGLYKTLSQRHNFYRFYCTLNGTQYLVGKATAILKQDIDSFPYPENSKEIDLSFWEEVLREDVLEYMAKYVRLGQNSKLLIKAAEKKDLSRYSDMFIKMLGSIYNNLKAGDPVFLNSLICQPFYFGERPEFSWLNDNAEEELKKIIYNENHAHLRTVRLLRFYGKNVLLIIKPDRLRYWIRSTAIKDADETLKDLYQQGY